MLDLSPESDFIVERLQPEQVRVVYPLIRAADPSITLREWMRYAGPLAARHTSRRGILVARRRTHRHPCGAACYWLQRHINRRAVLAVEHLAILELLHPDQVAAALIAKTSEVAMHLGCDRIRITLSGNHAQILQVLQEAGHRHEGITLSRAANPTVDRAA